MSLPPGWDDPAVLAAVAGGVLLVLWLLLRRRRPDIEGRVEALAQGQERLVGALTQMTEAQVAAQSRMIEQVESRLDRVQDRMGRALGDSAGRTADSLGRLSARISAIDAAQGRIETLSRDMLSLQDILSNKQARGAFGEVQLADLLSAALPPDAYSLQATLSTGRRVDALIRFPGPPGALAVDAKFPLEGYEALRAAEGEAAVKRAEAGLRRAVSAHISAIAERYIVPGETADQALMFLPSEAVFAELHARCAPLVRWGMERRVWIVSPATMMAVLHTLRGVMRDTRLVAEAARVRRELGALQGDLGRLGERVEALDRHFARAQGDLDALRTSAEKAGRRAARLESLEFDAPAADAEGPARAAGGGG
jgi:DNA recombination protein RmuC